MRRTAIARCSAALGEVLAISSGKGGTGKTTTACSVSYGLAERGKSVVCLDLDLGLRNLDIHFGIERRVIFDIVSVLAGDCSINQALIKDRKNPNLCVLAASQTKDKTVLTEHGMEQLIGDLRSQFDYVVLDSPAGIESGAWHAMYWADSAIIVTNPELSSCRDSDKMVGFIAAKSRRAERGERPVTQHLLVTRYDPQRAQQMEMLGLDDIQEMLGLPLIGVIPESRAALTATNIGRPIITLDGEPAAEAYSDTVERLLGKDMPLRFVEAKKEGLLSRLMGTLTGT